MEKLEFPWVVERELPRLAVRLGEADFIAESNKMGFQAKRKGEAAEMKKIVWVVALACIAYGQTSNVRVFHHKSEIDGEHTTTLAVSAKASYQGWIQVFRPELIVFCIQKGNERSLRLHLRSGILGTGEDFIVTRARFDGAEAEKLYWIHNDLNPTTYYAESAASAITPFLKAKAVLIEFIPFMTGRTVVAHFDLSGLGNAFAKYSECKLPDL